MAVDVLLFPDLGLALLMLGLFVVAEFRLLKVGF